MICTYVHAQTRIDMYMNACNVAGQEKYKGNSNCWA